MFVIKFDRKKLSFIIKTVGFTLLMLNAGHQISLGLKGDPFIFNVFKIGGSLLLFIGILLHQDRNRSEKS